MKCIFHPDRQATHTCVKTDPENSGFHASDIVYMRAPICEPCALLYRPVHTARVEPVEDGA